MLDAFVRFLGATCAAVMLTACAVSGGASPEAGATGTDKVPTVGQASPDPAPAAAAPPSDGRVVTAAPATPPAETADGQNSYRLRARDFIRVFVINEPDTQIERRINPDGTIDIPFLKKLVPVAGLTLTQAQVELAGQFRLYFKKPQVAISIVSYAERRVYVSGYVGRPGPIAIPPEETITLGRALAMAGGILPRGNRSEVTIKRARQGSPLVITKDVRRIDDGDEPDFVLEDEDQIYVRDSRI